MPRRFRRARRMGARRRYSIERRYIQGTPAVVPAQSVTVVVPSTTVQGKRTVSHLDIQLSSTTATTGTLFWAIVYTPAGTVPSTMNITAGSNSFYEPSQFVMASGLYDNTEPGNSSHLRVPLKRTLNEGDEIDLLLSATGVTAYSALITYAVAF